MNGARIRLVALVVTAVAFVSVAQAAELEHTVRGGEYASLIADHYYGDIEAADLLLSYNGKSGTVIHPGETMRVPYCEVHRVEPGETWSALARQYLGRASAYPTIAVLNGLEPERPLQVGQRIAMPVVVAHELARGETLAKLADRFYGDVRMGRLLAGFNAIDDPRRLSVGTKIDVPLVSLLLVAEPPSPEPPAPEEPREFEAPIREARQAYERAEFDAASAALERIRGDVEARGSRSEQTELWRWLAFVNVALDRHAGACAAYDSLTLLDPAAAEFDPDLVSPKIRRLLGECERSAS
jgi:LysM repeat protein